MMNNEVLNLMEKLYTRACSGKVNYCAIGTTNDGNLSLITMGRILPIVKLWVFNKGKVWTEKTFNGILLLRKATADKPAMFTLCDENGKPIASSLEEDPGLSCILLAAAKPGMVRDPTIPVSLKARFVRRMGAVAISSDDVNYSILRQYEGENLANDNFIVTERGNEHE